MLDWLRSILDTSDFPPRWTCGQWTDLHGWVHVASDVATWAAYTAIPAVLVYFIRRRSDLPFSRLFWLFSVFILACGTVHLLEAVIFWWPVYRLQAAAKVVTALASWATVLALIPTTPKALALPGLAAVNARLEAEVREREKAQRELGRSNAELEHFAYLASHDLQEPLRMVSSFCTLLGDRYRGKLDARADQFIHFAVDGARRMQAMIEGLLAYSRLGRSDLQLGPVECEAALREALDNLGAAVAESGAVVTHDSLPRVRSSPSLLVQVFQNLVGNAIKYRRADPARVHVSAEREGQRWALSVRDEGIGVPPEHAERIFDVFVRLHPPDEYPGTGLGLAVCRKVVELHGGRIEVTAAPGGGSVFRFDLPAWEAEDEP